MIPKGTRGRGLGEVSRSILEILSTQEQNGESGVPTGTLIQKVAGKLESRPTEKTVRNCYQTLMRLVNEGLIQKSGRGRDVLCTLTRSGWEKVGVKETSKRSQHPKRTVVSTQAPNPLLEWLELLNERLPSVIEYVRRTDVLGQRLDALEVEIQQLREQNRDGGDISDERLAAIQAALEAMQGQPLLEEEE